MKAHKIENQHFSEERSLYNLKDTEVSYCDFEGEPDGESVMKETRDCVAKSCLFNLRYPLWHGHNLKVEECKFLDNARAPLWYCHHLKLINNDFNNIKTLRECTDIEIKGGHIVSPEFGWKNDGIKGEDFYLDSVYAFLDSKNITLRNINFKGKYSFQYIDNLTIEDSVLDTKDAFWHSKNVTVKNCIVKGEYLAWFSENITFINCKISGTQPLCYVKNLVMRNCTMEDCDLAFEYSSCDVELKGTLKSIKNPSSGTIIIDEPTEVIIGDNVYPVNGKVIVRN